MKKIIILCLTLMFTTVAYAQKKWEPFVGVLLAVNADAYYFGPSITGGVKHFFGEKKKWELTPEIQFFSKKKKDIINLAEYESARFSSWSIRSNFNYYTGKKGGEGFFIGLGFGFQSANDKCYTYINGEIDKSSGAHFYELSYNRLMPTINFGYSIPSKHKTKWQFLITGIGPYTERNENSSYTEILSVLSSGVRVVF
jgi:hypothetical protein